MIDNVGEFYIVDEAVHSSNQAAGAYNEADKAVYEVIRIIDGIPLFLEDHYARLKSSLNLLKLELNIQQKDIRAQIEQLMGLNKKRNCNVKVTIFPYSDTRTVMYYISKSYYPVKEEYEKGIRVGLMQWERPNPNAKVINSEYKEKVARKIKEENVFEVLLFNTDRKITEGSRSNVFFVKGSKVFTAPDEYVLKGVTRKHIIDACQKAGYELIETLISLDSLKDLEGLFISGTSINVLPVSAVGRQTFESPVHPVIQDIQNQYSRMVQDYIKRNV